MDRRTELTAFLRSRRGRISPQQAGLHPHGAGRRRVPGLRREEVAQLAGVSHDYYLRFEQGRKDGVSDSVLDAVARTLRLTEVERRYLYLLARPDTRRAAGTSSPGPGGAGSPVVLRPGLQLLLNSLTGTPAYVIGRRGDILASNPIAEEIFFHPLPAHRRNMPRLVFQHPHGPAAYRDWATKAHDVVAFLRLDAARHPHDPQLATLIRELSAHPEFHRLWQKVHPVSDKDIGAYRLHHPSAGEFTLAFQALRLPEDPDQTLIAYTVDPASPAQAALAAIARHTPAVRTHRPTASSAP
ncbi:helix-turn-helix transcriptional regulator [Streptomyces sp. NPDC006645]|uniref:helix-turn-helix transcriptional regulator n=1 Tax=unclassified Streptomyces TaxID=2593676 RepID=UPI0033BC61CC